MYIRLGFACLKGRLPLVFSLKLSRDSSRSLFIVPRASSFDAGPAPPSLFALLLLGLAWLVPYWISLRLLISLLLSHSGLPYVLTHVGFLSRFTKTKSAENEGVTTTLTFQSRNHEQLFQLSLRRRSV